MYKILTFLLFSLFAYSADLETVSTDDDQKHRLEEKEANASEETIPKSDENTETKSDDFVDNEAEIIEEINLESDKDKNDSAIVDADNYDEDINNINDKKTSTSLENTKIDINLDNSDTVEDSSSTLKIISFIMLGLLSISLLMNYLLLRWRSRYKNQLITFPESLLDQFNNLGRDFSNIKSGVQSEFERYTEILKKQVNLNNDTSLEISQKYEEILDSFSLLQESLDSKDQEIERLKKGYDLQILKGYILKIIKVIDICDSVNQDQNTSQETKNEVTFISDSLNDLLDDMGVKKYYINSGISTKSDEFGLPPANEWTKVKTNEENENFLVKNTIKHGYFIDAEKKQVLKHPKIEVFIKGENNE